MGIEIPGSFIHSLTHSLTHLFIHLFTYLLINWLIHLFIHLFSHLFIYLFIHSLVRLFIHSELRSDSERHVDAIRLYFGVCVCVNVHVKEREREREGEYWQNKNSFADSWVGYSQHFIQVGGFTRDNRLFMGSENNNKVILVLKLYCIALLRK